MSVDSPIPGHLGHHCLRKTIRLEKLAGKVLELCRFQIMKTGENGTLEGGLILVVQLQQVNPASRQLVIRAGLTITDLGGAAEVGPGFAPIRRQHSLAPFLCDRPDAP